MDMTKVNLMDTTHNVTNVQTQVFWDSVASLYGENEMTTHSSDFEMDTVNNAVDSMPIPSVVASYGCADGSRDPVMILKNIKNDYVKVVLSDISPEMVKIAEKRVMDMNVSQKMIQTVVGPLEDIEPVKMISDGNIGLFVGVYSSCYLPDAMKIYSGNRNIIGNNFTVSHVFYSDNKIVQMPEKFQFEIQNFDEVKERIMDPSIIDKEGFLGYNVNTEKNFVSRYFNPVTLKKMMEDIFYECRISVTVGKDENSRYTIVQILRETDNETAVITMMNNVLGNITYYNQIKALENLREMWF